MNIIQVIPKEEYVPSEMFFESPIRTNYLWKNLIVEKRSSINRVDKWYKGSVAYAFWLVLSSPIS